MYFFIILNINFEKISFITLSIIILYKVFMYLWSISNLFAGSFCDIAQPYTLFTSEYLRYDDSYLILILSYMMILIIIFHLLIISFCISMNCVTYFSCNYFSTVSRISMSFYNSNFTSVFWSCLHC